MVILVFMDIGFILLWKRNYSLSLTQILYLLWCRFPAICFAQSRSSVTRSHGRRRPVAQLPTGAHTKGLITHLYHSPLVLYCSRLERGSHAVSSGSNHCGYSLAHGRDRSFGARTVGRMEAAVRWQRPSGMEARWPGRNDGRGWAHPHSRWHGIALLER